MAVPLSAFILGLSLFLLWNNRGLLAVYPGNGIILHDQYFTAVGVDGYHSAYDYVQKNVHHSVVNVENGWPFFLYDPQFTNSVTRSHPADYRVYIKTSWSGEEPTYPGFLDQPEWASEWQLVYEDPDGRVYKRK